MDTKKAVALCSAGQVIKERNRSNNKVKLCGYLKKKRNKVGGWRKMWFVLQDKLLLSYASKEEYDNKLVSFKDVLNLVPGTQVRPLGGFRFTIETTTHVMYTFHCDDRSAYREWITMLLDSLAGNLKAAGSISGAFSLSQRLYHSSVDNIPAALWCNAALNSPRHRELSSSCDSVQQHTNVTESARRDYVERIIPSRSTPAAAGGVRLPIARRTAKILERNGVNSYDPSQKQREKAAQQSSSQQRRQQQVECCNRSTSAQTITHDGGREIDLYMDMTVNAEPVAVHDSVAHFRLHQQADTKSTCVNANSMDNRQLPMCNIHSAASCQVNQAVLTINSMFQQTKTHHEPSHCGATQTTPMHSRPRPIRPNCDQTENVKYAKENTSTQDSMYDAVSNTWSESSSCLTKDCKALVMMKEQIQRLNIKGWKESQLHASTDAVHRSERSRIVITKPLDAKNMSASQLGERKAISNGNIVVEKSVAALEPIYAVVDLAHKYAQRKMRHCNEELNRCRSYESILNDVEHMANATGSESDKTKTLEKPYSVPTEDDVEGIYEDGEKFATNYTSLDASEDENIYEPINVSSAQPNAFWKYFTRLKVNSILQFKRMRKSGHVDYDTIKMSAQHPATETPVSPTAVTATETETETETETAASSPSSHFSSIKHKFGAHRKSVQVRVRKLCTRTNDPKPACKLQPKAHQQQQQQQHQSQDQQLQNSNANGFASAINVTNVTKNPKYRWKSVKIRPKHVNPDENGAALTGKQRFFGSLPHLRKARISLFSSQHLHSAKDRNGNVNNVVGTLNAHSANSNE